MTRNFEFSKGEFYHVYNRGNDKRKIFLTPSDYDRFIALLYLCNSIQPVHISLQGKNLNELLEIDQKEKLVEIGAYCLMPNHFHILIRESSEGGISRFMQKLTTGYTMYFNKKNERSGSLFQGVFKATHANSDEYLKYLFAYIHLNPIKLINPLWKENGLKNKTATIKHLDNYWWSSYIDYSIKKRSETRILSPDDFPNYFSNKKIFNEEIFDWLSFGE